MAKRPRYQTIDGVRVPLPLIPEVFRSSATYLPEDDDIVVVSYPACGATLVSQVVLLILRDGRPCKTADEYFSSSPVLEMVGSNEMKYIMKPGCIRTFLPFNRLKFSEKAKYFYVSRHPNDCVLPLYHHIKHFPTHFFTDGSFDDFLDAFVNGDVIYDDYYDHFLCGHTYGHYPNVMNIKYDYIKNNKMEAVLNIARFLGENYYRNLIVPGSRLLKDILYFSSDEYMSATASEFWRELLLNKSQSDNLQPRYPMFKKYGDWLIEAENSGYHLTDKYYSETLETTLLSQEQKEKLKSYLFHKEYDLYLYGEEEFSLFNNWNPENI